MSSIGPDTSLVDVCFIVCTALALVDTTVVLTGGSAATFYAPQAYQSRDADFIITLSGENNAATMKSLGYSEKGGTYVHKSNGYTVEFPKGPLAIGDDLITTWETFRRDDGHLNVLRERTVSATACSGTTFTAIRVRCSRPSVSPIREK